jgi:hypothetical protein
MRRAFVHLLALSSAASVLAQSDSDTDAAAAGLGSGAGSDGGVGGAAAGASTDAAVLPVQLSALGSAYAQHAPVAAAPQALPSLLSAPSASDTPPAQPGGVKPALPYIWRGASFAAGQPAAPPSWMTKRWPPQPPGWPAAPPPPPSRDMAFLALADWGGQTDWPMVTDAQLQCAPVMAQVVSSLQLTDVVAAGDNFYDSGIVGAWNGCLWAVGG